MALTFDTLKAALPQLVSAMPTSWRGTTFRNENLLLRAGFCQRLSDLIISKQGKSDAITTDELLAVGNAEDYLRVSSNLSTVLELLLSLSAGFPTVDQVFTFSSKTMPLVAVALATQKTVHVHHGRLPAPFTEDQLKTLGLIGAQLVLHDDDAPVAAGDDIVVKMRSALIDGPEDSAGVVDAVVGPSVLFIVKPDRVDTAKVLVVRKRMAIPLTTPACEELLQSIAGVAVTANQAKPDTARLAEFHAHLQTLSGTKPEPSLAPLTCTAGLPTMCSLWVTMVAQGGADILMCSTAYGGSSQLVDVLGSSTPTIKKHTFDIQGTRSIVDSIQHGLDTLAAQKDSLLPTTVLLVEMPTNPDMKVPDLTAVAQMVSGYTSTTGKRFVLLVDATFAPNSQIMTKIQELVPEVTVIVFLSMSKSVSRGMTTAGTLIVNHTPEAANILNKAKETAAMLDSITKPDQDIFLVDNHEGVEDRCAVAYKVAERVGDALRVAVRVAADGYDMPLAFVTPEQAALGFTTSTFSFNLPPPKGATAEINAGLAQKFVDLICAHREEFKPCVSFGQDNGLVYATVPATSTQGAIKEEDKAKQAVGGVQLVRLSFPPQCNVPKLIEIVADSVAALYKQ